MSTSSWGYIDKNMCIELNNVWGVHILTAHTFIVITSLYEEKEVHTVCWVCMYVFMHLAPGLGIFHWSALILMNDKSPNGETEEVV